MVITTLNGLPGSWDSFIQRMSTRRKLILSREHTRRISIREKKMGATEDQALTIQRRSPQAMRNMKNSTLEEPLIHLSIWIMKKMMKLKAQEGVYPLNK